MKLPVRSVSMPAALRGKLNGRLPASVLAKVPGLDGSPDVWLARPADRAWRAMAAAAQQAGHTFKISHQNSAYRPHRDQERIFRARYYPSILGTRRWQGQRWRKRSGVAAAAVPGTSNHGWGLAVDIGEERDFDPAAESISTSGVQWLIGNAARFGWSAEIQSERWHWRYFAGDAIPAAVLEFERSNHPEEDTMILLHDTDSNTFRVAVPGEGSAVITDPTHWAGVIAEGRKTGLYASKYMSNLIDKIRAERA